MKNKGIKITIITLILAIIIISIILFNITRDNDIIKPDPPTHNEEDFIVNYNVKKLNVTNDYFILKNITEEYFSYCKKLNMKKSDLQQMSLKLTEEQIQDYLREEENLAKEHLNNMLSKEYLDEFNINQENLKEKLSIENESIAIINSVYYVSNSLNVSTYFISGTLIDNINLTSNKFNIAISLDMLNNTFCIYPEQYIKEKGYNNINESSNIKIDIESIENNKQNTFEYEIINDSQICQEYFNNYKNMALYNSNLAYEMLNNEYKEKRFGNVETYIDYINKYKSKLYNSNIKKYECVNKNEYKQYICIDEYKNYYIFNATSIADYNVVLDSYTIDSEEFLAKYNRASDEVKVGYNIQKCIEAFNNKDYNYVYNQLDETFKNNNFINKDKFIEYIDANLFEYNNISYDNVKTEGNIIIYKTTITDKTEKNNNIKNMEFIMKLKEGTDFVMSFNIK